MKFETVKLDDLLEILTDYHANGAYKKLKENVELLDDPDYAVMIRTTNFEQNEYDSNLKYISEHAYNFLEKSKVHAGDLVMNKIANAGSTYLMPELGMPVSLAMNLFLLRINPEKANPTYVYIYLKINESYVKNFANGSVTKTITKEAVRNLEIELPKRPIQDDIANIYFSLSDKIELNRQTNQTLEQIAQAVFTSWFVDFDPVKAKNQAIKSGQDPEIAAMCAISGKTTDQLEQLNKKTKQQLKETSALFPDSLVASEFGEIPEGWNITTLNQLIEFNPKRTLKKGTIAPYLEMKNVPTKGHIANNVYNRKMRSGTKFINGDTLLARITPCLENGKTAFVDFLKDNEVGWGSTEYIVMHPKGERPPSLGYFLARLDSFRSKAVKTMTGTSGRQRANAKALADLPWVDYPIELLKVFDTIADSYLSHAKSNGEQNKTLSEIRDTLLPKLLSGEIEIKI